MCPDYLLNTIFFLFLIHSSLLPLLDLLFLLWFSHLFLVSIFGCLSLPLSKHYTPQFLMSTLKANNGVVLVWILLEAEPEIGPNNKNCIYQVQGPSLGEWNEQEVLQGRKETSKKCLIVVHRANTCGELWETVQNTCSRFIGPAGPGSWDIHGEISGSSLLRGILIYVLWVKHQQSSLFPEKAHRHWDTGTGSWNMASA